MVPALSCGGGGVLAGNTKSVMLCGGTEACICPMGIGGFAAMRALSTRNGEPEKASRPWDKQRDGFVVGEGSGMLTQPSVNRRHTFQPASAGAAWL